MRLFSATRSRSLRELNNIGFNFAAELPQPLFVLFENYGIY